KRFGNFLKANVDWALSRERYWGTPLPIWQCEQTGYQEAIGRFDELLAKPGVRGLEAWSQARGLNPGLPDDLQVHKPYIDEITYDSPKAPGHRMRRVSEVIDCWYDAGAMPFAQWGYPYQNVERFQEQFPADFISEAQDQTRGWFYSLLAISTLLFTDARHNAGDAQGSGGTATTPYPHPFRNCIVLGLMLSEWYESPNGKVFLSEEDARAEVGKGYQNLVGKMSKSKRNYREPQEIFDRHGADALRWYFFANQAPWTSIRYSERAIKESIPEFLLRLWNVFSFFVLYANLDGFDPGAEIAGDVGQVDEESLRRAKSFRPVAERSELDRWILCELERTMIEVTARMDAYDNYSACGQLHAFVDALSNWYVRRSRDRFWSDDKSSQDKRDAYWTLYECLLTTSKLIAPFTPFLAETLWRTLTGVFGERASESVHLCDYPGPRVGRNDEPLSRRMRLAREICSLGRAARMEQKLKVRQPLAKVEVILAEEQYPDPDDRDWLESHSPLIAEELNVKQVEFTREAEKYITFDVKPNFKILGPRVGKLMPEVKQALIQADPAKLMAEMQKGNGSFRLQLPSGEAVELSNEELQVGIRAREGWAAAQGNGCVVVLSTELTPSLILEGMAR
ncbi:MAG TPA: class I tRNA ligase family protein, partial [Pirellulaceae bacterium]